MYCFCTYFDKNYFTRGQALYRSLKENCPEFCLWVLCMDTETHAFLSQMALPEIRLIRLDDFENGDVELINAKNNRSKIEYYFTCTPSLPLFVLNNNPQVDLITYIDADLYFFSDPTPIYQEINGASIAIIAHRFSPSIQELAINGIYNVGWLTFRRDEEGFKCLKKWRDCCNENCSDKIKGANFADQKYLDNWPAQFKNLVVLQNKGANLAYWNIDNYNISTRDDLVWVDDQPLIFFHFQGLKQLVPGLYDTGFYRKVRVTKIISNYIFRPYIKILLNINEDLLEKLNVDLSLNRIRRNKSLFRFLSLFYRGIIVKKYILFRKG